MISWPWSRKKTYQWIATNDEPVGEVIRCIKGSPETEYYARLAVVKDVTPFHDKVLIDATRHINEILDGVRGDKRDKNRVLAFLKIPGVLFLAWTQHGEEVTAQSDPKDIDKALGLSEAQQ